MNGSGRLVPWALWGTAAALAGWRIASAHDDGAAPAVIAVTLAVAVALGLLARRGLPGAGAAAVPAAVCLLLATRPAGAALTGALPTGALPTGEGAAGLLPVLLVAGGWLLAGSLPRGAGGAAVGLGAVLSPPLLLFAPLLWLTGRRADAGTAAGAFAAGTVLVRLLGPDPGGDAPVDDPSRQSLHAALLRLGASGPEERVLYVALAALVCVPALRRAARYARDGQPLLAAAVTGCAALAAAPAATAVDQVWILAALAGRAGRRTADRPVWPVFAVLVLAFDGDALVPKIGLFAPLGENFPLLAALLAACVVRFTGRDSALWDRPVDAGPAARPNLLLELLLIRVGYFCYSWIRGRADGDRATAEAHGHQVLDVQRALGLDIEHALNHAVADTPWLSGAMDVYYSTFHFAVPLAILGWLLATRPAAYRAARRALAFATLLGLAGFWLYPLAPPRLMPGLGYIDTANGPQDLDSPRYGHLTGISNPYAAMPSLHVGWSLWCAVVLWRVAPWRWLRVAGFAYPLLTTVVVMGTANHYLLDAVGGALVVALGTPASDAVGRALDARRAVAAVAPREAAPAAVPAEPAGAGR